MLKQSIEKSIGMRTHQQMFNQWTNRSNANSLLLFVMQTLFYSKNYLHSFYAQG